MKRVLKLTFAVVLVSALLFTTFITVSADSFDSYIYDSDNMAVEAPAAANVEYSFNGNDAGAGSFASPQDIYAEGGMLYIADKDNNRIVILDSNCKFKGEIKSFQNGEKLESIKEPEGIYVKDGKIYICDSGNYRIVVLDKSFKLLDIITLLKGDSLPSDFVFKPIKLSVDATGRIFVVSEGFSNGLLEFTPSGEYVRYLGASKVSLTPAQMFWRMFQTKAQREKSASNVSAVYNNVEVDSEGFLFVTSSAFTNWEYASGKAKPLARINAKGSDVLVRFGNPSGDSDYPDPKSVRATYTGASTLVDICTLPYGNYAVLDRNRGRIFAYNSDGELMYEFGGPGNISGGLTVATALEYVDGRFYTVDSSKNQINVYSLTEYGKLFNDVSKASQELNYKEEEALWSKIVNKNANCTLAMRGLGNAAYRKQDMTTAMDYYKLARDTEGYSKAYVFVRRQFIEQNAIWLLLGVIALAAAGIALSKGFKKLVAVKGVRSYADRLDFAGYVVFHPIRGFWELKREKRGSALAGLTIFGIALLVKILSSVATGFLFNPTGSNNYSIFTDLGIMLGILILWSVSQWCVTVLMSGEGTYKEILTATCYSFTPYIVLSSIGLVLSHVLSLDEAELYTVMIGIGLVYTVFLLFMSVVSTHDYTIGKALLVTVIMIVVILLVLFILLLIITLTQQMVSFVTDLYNEISFRI